MAYATADIVISRAGALSIAELCVRRKPTILVPSSNVVGDHQTKNTLPLADQGAVIHITNQQCPFRKRTDFGVTSTRSSSFM